MRSILFFIGKVFGILIPIKIITILNSTIDIVYVGFICSRFKKFGKNNRIKRGTYFKGENNIYFGSNISLGRNGVLTAWSEFCGFSYKPRIIFGDNVSIGDGFHITAINKIIIGENVLMGQKVTITDNSHGNTEGSVNNIHPNKRALYSKGEVIIEKNVWIGDKVTILPGLIIGEGSIIAANSVVTKNVPKNCIFAGIPSKKIKELII